jgi:hypothetical protein
MVFITQAAKITRHVVFVWKGSALGYGLPSSRLPRILNLSILKTKEPGR